MKIAVISVGKIKKDYITHSFYGVASPDQFSYQGASFMGCMEIIRQIYYMIKKRLVI